MIRDHIEDYGGRLYEKCQHCHLVTIPKEG